MVAEAEPEGGSPADELTDLAERALLGALLWDPRRLRDVTSLRGEDFLRPFHQALFDTMMRLAAAGRPIHIEQLPRLLRQSPHLSVRISPQTSTPELSLLDMLRITPAAPPAPGSPMPKGEHARYAAIVLEASIRRQVTAVGAQIDQTASTQAEQRAPGAVDDTAQTLGGALDAAGERLDFLAQRLTTLTDLPAQAMGHSVLPVLPPPTASQAVAREEHTLVGACLTQPGLRDVAITQLRPDDFRDPAAAATWVALTALHTRGGPVDFILLAADLQTRGAHPVHGGGLRPTQLAKLAHDSAPPMGSWALTGVAHRALLGAIDQAQHLLTAAAADPTQAAGPLLATVRETLNRLDTTRRRLANVDPPSVTAPSARAPARARTAASRTPPAPRPTHAPGARARAR